MSEPPKPAELPIEAARMLAMAAVAAVQRHGQDVDITTEEKSRVRSLRLSDLVLIEWGFQAPPRHLDVYTTETQIRLFSIIFGETGWRVHCWTNPDFWLEPVMALLQALQDQIDAGRTSDN